MPLGFALRIVSLPCIPVTPGSQRRWQQPRDGRQGQGEAATPGPRGAAQRSPLEGICHGLRSPRCSPAALRAQGAAGSGYLSKIPLPQRDKGNFNSGRGRKSLVGLEWGPFPARWELLSHIPAIPVIPGGGKAPFQPGNGNGGAEQGERDKNNHEHRAKLLPWLSPRPTPLVSLREPGPTRSSISSGSGALGILEKGEGGQAVTRGSLGSFGRRGPDATTPRFSPFPSASQRAAEPRWSRGWILEFPGSFPLGKALCPCRDG